MRDVAREENAAKQCQEPQTGGVVRSRRNRSARCGAVLAGRAPGRVLAARARVPKSQCEHGRQRQACPLGALAARARRPLTQRRSGQGFLRVKIFPFQ